MADGGIDERGGAALPPASGIVDDRDLDTPNCPECLVRMEAEESASGEPFWSCTECGLVAVAVA